MTAELLLWAALAVTPAAASPLINGDFQAGNLFGWSASAISGTIPPLPVPPLIGVEAAPSSSNFFTLFSSGTFGEGAFVSTLQQAFMLPVGVSLLAFDVFIDVSSNTGETGTDPFGDAFSASLSDGANVYDLVLLDAAGAVGDPFGTAPGEVRVGTPTDPFFEFGIVADVSAIAGRNVTLFFDISSANDAAITEVGVDNISIVGAVSEPSSLILIVTLVPIIGALSSRRKMQGMRASDTRRRRRPITGSMAKVALNCLKRAFEHNQPNT